MILRAATMLGARARVIWARVAERLGLRPDSFLVIVAVLIGLVAAAAAVAFHQLIVVVRGALYERLGAERLYNSLWMLALIAWPALGGLIVGLLARFVLRGREGHGVVDVMESVVRSSGFIRPITAVEKIVTSAVTIGTGGSCGAEGPIVQIGAAISSGAGRLFQLTRAQMPTMIGCGAAAGISAIFNSPMGGLLFALEVILQDFSIRNVTPVLVASVVANVATRAIFAGIVGMSWESIFFLPKASFVTNWQSIGNFAILGVLCGITAVAMIKLLYASEDRFHRLKLPSALKPALGGAMLGLLGITYVLVFGRGVFGQHKPIPFEAYPMPAFFGDGYGVIQLLLTEDFYAGPRALALVALLAFFVLAKLLGTCLTLGSGGSGGVIAPALFLGAAIGGLLGMTLRAAGLLHAASAQPQTYALVGMVGVLAAVVHAPLAAILILLELTRDPATVLPAMLVSVMAAGVGRALLPDSIYTLALRRRGVRMIGGGDTHLLYRLNVEQVDLEPTTLLKRDEPFERVLALLTGGNIADFPVVDAQGQYIGLVVEDDIRTALLAREATPLLLVHELARTDIPIVSTADDLATTLDSLTRHDVSRLAVCLPGAPSRVIGMVSRTALMRRYQLAISADR